MKISKRHLLTSSFWAGTLGVGILIGHEIQPPSDPTANREISKSDSNQLGPTTAPLKRPTNNPRDIPPSDHSLHGSPEERREQAKAHLAEILNISSRVERTRSLLTFIDHLNPSDFESVVSGFTEAGWVQFNRSEFSFLLSSWMSQDPFSALDYLKKNETDGWARRTAIAAWASENPAIAASAIQGLEDQGQVNDWIVGMVKGMARNDPSTALSTLLDLPDGDTRQQGIKEILPEVAARGPSFASEWIEMIGDPKLQVDTAKRLGRDLARQDPESASLWVAGLTSVRSRRDASEVVSEIYASQDVDAAMTWVETLPLDTASEAAEGVTTHLTRRDPAEAARWLQSLGENPDLDGARIRFLREATDIDPEVALNNIHTLSRSSDQENYHRHILGRWKRRNEEAAINWAIENSESLSERVFNSVVPKNRR